MVPNFLYGNSYRYYYYYYHYYCCCCFYYYYYFLTAHGNCVRNVLVTSNNILLVFKKLGTIIFNHYRLFLFKFFYTGAPIVGIARWSVPGIGQGHLEVKW